MTCIAKDQRRGESLGCRPETRLPDEDVIALGKLFVGNGVSSGMARAESLLQRFGGLRQALSAPPYKMRAMQIDDEDIRILDGLRHALVLALKRDTQELLHLGSVDAVADYIFVDMAYRRVEVFKVLFLDGRNRLVHDDILHVGTLDKVEVHPRAVLQMALEVNAAALILSHNHPSGDPTPSAGDVAITKTLRSAARALGVHVHDHLVVSRGGWTSMRREGLLVG